MSCARHLRIATGDQIMTRLSSKVLLVFSGIILVSQGAVWAQNQDIGHIEYLWSCAVCHGIDAKGSGPLAAQLKTSPTDLTRLAENNGGVLPVSTLYETIDGRQEVKAHGTRDMPAWGYRYM